MNRAILLAVLAAGTLGAFSASVAACTFQFSYDAIEAPLGTVGQIGVRVVKTHNQCVLTSMDEYEIDGDHVQILSQSAWVEVSRNTYETWLEVSLSETGDGALVISKTCSKEGYEEGVLSIHVTSPTTEGFWTAASGKTYPFDAPAGGTVEVVSGTLTWDATGLYIAGLTYAVPRGEVPATAISEAGTLFYTDIDGIRIPLLAVGPSIFVRFDALPES